MRSISWEGGEVWLIDQTRLPHELVTIRTDDPFDIVRAIGRLAVRGAPAIGVAGALGVALAARRFSSDPASLADAIDRLREARPTAVNLARMVDRAARRVPEGWEQVLDEARAIMDEEFAASWAMGELGADLVERLCGGSSLRAMTICNTGGLATVERGTALAVIQTLFERGRIADVLPLETRPLLQGARLTTWELQQMGAPFHLIVDSAGPFLLSRGAADVVLVGADRVARNGDVANKIGTFSLALAAAHAGVPFIVVAPESTVDLSTASGAEVVIEDRGPAEVVSVRGTSIAPDGTQALNPAFDVTPVDLITALVTDRRIVHFDKGETLDSTTPDPAEGSGSAATNTGG